MLAGVSADYYTRLETGNLTGVSESVLDAIARALQLDEAERPTCSTWPAPRNTSPRTPRRRRPTPQVRPGVQRLLDAMTDAPPSSATAASTSSPPTLSAAPCTPGLRRPAAARSTSPASVPRPGRAATSTPTGTTPPTPPSPLLRTEAGRDPYDRGLTDLDRRARPPAARTSAPAGPTTTSACTAPAQALPPPGRRRPRPRLRGHGPRPPTPASRLTAYTAEPGTAVPRRPRLLASWAATRQREDTPGPARAITPRARQPKRS